MKRLAGYTIIVMATLLAVFLMWQFRSVVALFLLSLTVLAAVKPLVGRLTRMGLSRAVAVTLVYLAGLVLVLAAILLAGRQLLSEVQTLTDGIASSYEAAYPDWRGGSTFQQTVAAQLPPPEVLYEMVTNASGGSIGERVLGLSRGMLGLAGGIVVVLSLSIYWTIDQTRFERLALSLLPVSYRARARSAMRATEEGVGSFLRHEAIQSIVALILLSLGYWALGVDFPLTLAIIGAIMWLIPMVGALLAIPPVFFLSLPGGLGLAVLAVIFTLLVLWLLEFIVGPRLFQRQQYSPILTVLLMLVLIEDFGVLGLVVAAPLAVAIQSLAAFLYDPAETQTSAKPDAYLASLKDRLEKVRARNAAAEEMNGPEIDNLTGRLDGLIERVERMLPSSSPSQ